MVSTCRLQSLTRGRWRYDAFMDREHGPDRKGFLEFREAIKNGDKTLLRRAELERQKDGEHPRTTLSHYYEALRTEALIGVKAQSQDHRDQLARNAEQRLAKIEDQVIRQNASRLVAERVETWDKERRQSHDRFVEMRDAKINGAVTRRQAQDHEDLPERVAESWFWAKCEIDANYLGELGAVESAMQVDISHVIHDAHERDLKALEEQRAQSPEQSYFADGADNAALDAFNREVEQREAQEGLDRDGGYEFSK